MHQNTISLPLPIALNAAVRALAAGLKVLVRAYRYRQDMRALAGLDRAMLNDIGINPSDVRDALSQPLWKDPTALLRERAAERRDNRGRVADAPSIQPVEQGFTRPPLDRPARQAI